MVTRSPRALWQVMRAMPFNRMCASDASAVFAPKIICGRLIVGERKRSCQQSQL